MINWFKCMWYGHMLDYKNIREWEYASKSTGKNYGTYKQEAFCNRCSRYIEL